MRDIPTARWHVNHPGATRVTQRSRDQAGNGIDQDQGGELTPAEHIIADGDFVGYEMLADTFVNALIASTQ